MVTLYTEIYVKTNIILYLVLSDSCLICQNVWYIQFGIFASCLSLDEMMIKHYRMHSAKMFMRGKSIKFGYKFWCVAEAHPGG